MKDSNAFYDERGQLRRTTITEDARLAVEKLQKNAIEKNRRDELNRFKTQRVIAWALTAHPETLKNELITCINESFKKAAELKASLDLENFQNLSSEIREKAEMVILFARLLSVIQEVSKNMVGGTHTPKFFEKCTNILLADPILGDWYQAVLFRFDHLLSVSSETEASTSNK